jgi:spermidine/putrescine transport system ATP-binding protein
VSGKAKLKKLTDIAVECIGLSKNYGTVTALKSVDFKIDSGQYYVLLGPSGGGKTTLLRLIGGFLRPTRGQVHLHGQDVSNLPPNLRSTSMVFQSYALFPHMTVAGNVGYGLKLRKLPAGEIAENVRAMLSLVGLSGFEDRLPHELSGGQQQRVQLARALVLESKIILLDEPLAALDAKLRKDMCFELKRIQEQVGITFVHVTHNQEEAMTVADRIAIIADGELIEEGIPQDIYRQPVKQFTAAFIGENNIFDGKVKAAKGNQVKIDAGSTIIAANGRDKNLSVGDKVAVSIRSELCRIHGEHEKAARNVQKIPATYMEEFFLGLTVSHLVKLKTGQDMIVREAGDSAGKNKFSEGDDIYVAWELGDARLHTS